MMKFDDSKMNNSNLKLFLGCIPSKHDKAQLLRFLRKYGEDIEIVEPRNHKRSNSGFVILQCGSLKTHQTLLNSSLKFKNRLLDCSLFIEGEKLLKEKDKKLKRRLILPSMPSEISEAELQVLFEGVARVERVYKIKTKKGFLTEAHVILRTQKEAKNCMALRTDLSCKGYRLEFFLYKGYKEDKAIRKQEKKLKIERWLRKVYGEERLKENPSKRRKMILEELNNQNIKILTKLAKLDSRIYNHSEENLEIRKGKNQCYAQ